MEPREVLDQISACAQELMQRHARVFQDDVRPALASEGITVVRWDELSSVEQERLQEMFREQIFPVLTPLAVDPAHPFPYISGLSLNLAVVVRNTKTLKEHFARVKVPPLLPRFIAVEDAGSSADRASTQRSPTRTSPGSCRSRTSSPRTWTSSSRAWT